MCLNTISQYYNLLLSGELSIRFRILSNNEEMNCHQGSHRGSCKVWSWHESTADFYIKCFYHPKWRILMILPDRHTFINCRCESQCMLAFWWNALPKVRLDVSFVQSRYFTVFFQSDAVDIFNFFFKTCSDYLLLSTWRGKWCRDFSTLFVVTFRKSRQREQKGEVFQMLFRAALMWVTRRRVTHLTSAPRGCWHPFTLRRACIASVKNLEIKFIHVLNNCKYDRRQENYIVSQNVTPGCILTFITTTNKILAGFIDLRKWR